MSKVKTAALLFAVSAAMTAQAGGILTNTNQNIAFNRNMARDGAIGIDGVYSNPAGVAFLKDGLHLSFNLQSAIQTRTIDTRYGELFKNNVNEPASADNNYKKHYKGDATAPIVPSIQAAYNKNRWSFQFNFAIIGGGGKCTFDEGLGSFEGVVATIPAALINGGINTIMQQKGMQLTGGYGVDAYMKGRSYYYGFTLGAAYKVLDNLSVYGGLRLIYANTNYYGYVKNIQFQINQSGVDAMVPASKFLTAASETMLEAAGKYSEAASQYSAAGDATTAAKYSETAETAQTTGAYLGTLSTATQDIELNCNQKGLGIAPIIGVDYKIGKFNFATKFEFKTRLRLKNQSANSASAAAISSLEQFADGKKVPGDMPALLTVGAQYEITPKVRVMAGYHHFFDIDTPQFSGDKMSDTNEYLFGAEWDISKVVQVSAGVQRTDYNQEEENLNDISFSLDSWSWGLGVGIQVTKNLKLNVAYFESDYNGMSTNMTNASGIEVSNDYMRTNHVIGIGADLTF